MEGDDDGSAGRDETVGEHVLESAFDVAQFVVRKNSEGLEDPCGRMPVFVSSAARRHGRFDGIDEVGHGADG